jgi:hypothetical protein
MQAPGCLVSARGDAAADAMLARRDAPCDRCTAVGRRFAPGGTHPSPWDDGVRFCHACLLAVRDIVDRAGPVSPTHSGAPHFLWRPDMRGFAAQLARDGAA